MTNPATASQPDLGFVLRSMNSYQVTMALKGAIELDVFTHIAAGAKSAEEIAKRCQASEKGTRVLCDYLTIQGFLTKQDGAYGLSPESALFLDKASPAYMGSTAMFLTHPSLLAHYSDVAAIVRKGGALSAATLAPDAEVWVEFARSMAPMMSMPAQMIAPQVTTPGQPVKVLDIAAGHGVYGIFVAKHNPAAQVVGQDWDNVLEVARENAQKMGVADRYSTIAGSAFDVDLGTGYDVVLVPNFLHHFDVPTNVKLLKKIRAAMKPSGMVATVEFVPNEDRVTPPLAAAFAMQMLGGTEAGDAYTFAELDKMFRDAGFGASEIRSLTPAPSSLILTKY
ncbi:MAG: class I SAM-dependent methyltransferase [Acidobacteriota bacterium]